MVVQTELISNFSFAASVNDWVLSLVIDIYYQLLSFLASDSYPAPTIQFYP